MAKTTRNDESTIDSEYQRMENGGIMATIKANLSFSPSEQDKSSSPSRRSHRGLANSNRGSSYRKFLQQRQESSQRSLNANIDDGKNEIVRSISPCRVVVSPKRAQRSSLEGGDNNDGYNAAEYDAFSMNSYLSLEEFTSDRQKKQQSQSQQNNKNDSKNDGQSNEIKIVESADSYQLENKSIISEGEDIYYVKQPYGYLSISFAIVQTLVLIVMMIQCGVSPMTINPMVGPYPDALSYWGGKNAVLIIEDDEWWRLITPIFLHAGVIHLLCNISVQLESGAFFEREWGSSTWFLIYITSAFGSSILSTCAMPNSIGVGSSGAVMGLFGGKLAEVLCKAYQCRKSRQGRIGHEVRMEQLSGILCSIFVVGLMSFIPYVDWAAHLGGLVAGFTVGLVTFSFTATKRAWGMTWCVLGIVLTIVTFALALDYMYNEVEAADELRDVCGYYAQYFEDYECHCQKKG